MLRGASTVLLGKNVHVSRPFVSPKLPVASQRTLALPPDAAPNARWVLDVSKPLIGPANAVVGGLLPQSTLLTVLPAFTTTSCSVTYRRSSYKAEVQRATMGSVPQ